MKQDQRDKIQEITFATAKGSIGAGGVALAVAYPQFAAIALIAPYLPELLGLFLPARRLDRVEQMLLLVLAKLSHLEPDFLKEKMKEEDYQNLFERGCQQASQATTKMRLEAIANVLASACQEKSQCLMADRCLTAIESLDNFDLYILVEIHTLAEKRLKEKTDDRHWDIYRKNCPGREDVERMTKIWFTGDENDDTGAHQSIARHTTQKLTSSGLTVMEGRVDDGNERWYPSDFGIIVLKYIQG